MKGKPVRDSIVIMARAMNPQDANPSGNVHGGVIMKFIDEAAGAAAIKHSRSNCVTASIDRLDFHHPVFVGDLVTARASINYTGKSSMEAGVRVESQNLFTGETRHTVSAYMTFVALDKNGRPAPIPPLILETPEEERRNREAKARRETRLREKSKEKECQKEAEKCNT
ncbi:MAG TPA: acyl-CoA thioesterase [Syntrophales bacterium]|nr:acyl-CoA thioesterase [Syntrophales bacterium]HOX94865.1 acyl-CoA thioesterase [Syntrophales bacterium]HPI56412.1 acyl-CoA thioesterase [Syntrophales bacterium]HPN24201.1 acyl-CoA thioesterase [Syntrophales bacterium]HQM28554.1 acyl-CoA thioesterase [Syntrophales bacterium]